MSARDPATHTLDDLDALLEARMASRRERRREKQSAEVSLGGVGLEDILRILALAPQWTEELVERVLPDLFDAGLFSRSSRLDTEQALDGLEQRGWLSRARSAAFKAEGEAPLLSGPTVLSLDAAAARGAITSRLEEQDGYEKLWGDLVELADGIKKLASSQGALRKDRLEPEMPPFLPAVTVRWALLAASAERDDGLLSKTLRAGRPRVTSWQAAADFLEQRLADVATGETLRWIEAAQPLAAVLIRSLDTTLDMAVRRAALGLELRDRRRHDLKLLESFLERADQIEAVQRLIDDANDPEEPWALHLLGAGGVGKTMMIRHLTAQIAEREQLAIGRVDFDFLNPDYPRLAPGLLLWAFAQELGVFDRVGQASGVFEDSERLLRQVHEEMKGGNTKLERASDHPLFEDGLKYFAQALALLPPPVILVIDTCEELAKPRAGVDAKFNIDETFKILELIHSELPTLRVVFAGRRPLATAGAGWTCERCELPERDYLGLFEMRGFKVEEAQRYLEMAGVAAELIEPVIQRASPEAGSAIEIEWSDGRKPAPVLRCNPYELRFFAEWALDTPPPSPEEIANATGERYVELRILRRLQSSRVVEVLPILGLARHLDRELLAAVTELDGSAFEDFLVDLQQQEWIERRPVRSESGVRWIYSVQEGLRLRLLGYFDPSHSDSQRQKALAVLKKRLLEGEPAAIDFTDLDAALRVMAGLEGSDLWWRQVEERLLAVKDSEWVAQRMMELESDEGAGALPKESSWPELRTVHPLRPAVLATRALAESQTPNGGVTPWMDAAEGASSLPLIGADLELRARAMVLVGGLKAGWDSSPVEARWVWRLAGQLRELPSPETAVAVLAAMEAAVERFEEKPSEVGAEDRLRLAPEDMPPADMAPDHLPEFFEDGSEELATRWLWHVFQVWQGIGGEAWIAGPKIAGLEAMLLALDGRVTAALGQERSQAIDRFERAVQRAAGAESGDWLIWLAPENLEMRVRVEAMRALFPAFMSAGDALERFGGDLSVQSDIDADRFFSSRIELGLADGLRSKAFQLASPPAQSSEHGIKAETLCLGHLTIPPFELQRIRVAAAQGELESAFRRWSSIAREADEYAISVVRHAARAELRWANRLRYFDGEPGAALSSSGHAVDYDLVALAEALSGERRQKNPIAAMDSVQIAHAAWQRLVSPPPERLEEAMVTANHRLEQIDWPSLELADAQTIFDGLEAALLAGDSRLSGDLARLVATVDLGRFRHQPEATWRCHLRRVALQRWQGEGEVAHLSAVHEILDHSLVERLGSRRAGLIAWEEADFLALRQPLASSILFATARRLLADAADSIGEAICLTAQCCCLVQAHPEAVRTSFEELRGAWQRAGHGIERQTQNEALEEALARIPKPLQPWWLRAFLLSWYLAPEPKVRQRVPETSRRLSAGAPEPLAAWMDAAADGLVAQAEDDWGAELSKGAEEVSEPVGSEPLPSKPLRSEPVPPSPPLNQIGDDDEDSEEKTPDDHTGAHFPVAPSAPPAKPEPALPPKGLLERASTGIGILIGVGIVSALVAAIYLAIDSIFASSTIGTALLSLLALGVIVWVGGIAIAIRTILRRARALRLSMVEQIVLDESDGSPARHFQVTAVEKKFKFGWPPWKDQERGLPGVAVELSKKAEEYAALCPRLSELAESDFASWELFDLRMHRGHNLAWEGILGAKRTLHARRQARASAWRRFADGGGIESSGVLIATGSTLGLDAVLRGYASLGGFGLKLRPMDGSGLENLIDAAESEKRPERVAHFVGGYIRLSSGGLRFRLSDDRKGSHFDLRAQDVVARMPDLGLVILQETPVSEVLKRSGADRRQADWLREFAADLQLQGVPAVMTLPHLPPATAAECIEQIAKLLIRRRRLLDVVLGRFATEVDMALLDTVDRIRRIIMRTDSFRTDGVSREAAWDVVLYAPPGWLNPFAKSQASSGNPASKSDVESERTQDTA